MTTERTAMDHELVEVRGKEMELGCAVRKCGVNFYALQRRFKRPIQRNDRPNGLTESEEKLIVGRVLEFADRWTPLSKGIRDLVEFFLTSQPNECLVHGSNVAAP